MPDFRICAFLTLHNEMNCRKSAEKLRMEQPGKAFQKCRFGMRKPLRGCMNCAKMNFQNAVFPRRDRFE